MLWLSVRQRSLRTEQRMLSSFPSLPAYCFPRVRGKGLYGKPQHVQMLWFSVRQRSLRAEQRMLSSLPPFLLIVSRVGGELYG